MSFRVYAVWWNGHEFETIKKDAKSLKAAIGLSSLLLREVRPKQIWIIDLDNKEPIPNDLHGIASSLNKDESSNQLTLDEVST